MKMDNFSEELREMKKIMETILLLWSAVGEKCLNFQQIYAYQVSSNLCRWKKSCLLQQGISLTVEEKATDRSGYHKPG